MATKPERRHITWRRDLNDMVRDPGGKVSEAKIMAVLGQGACLYLMLAFTDEVLKTEYTLLTLLVFVIAPDLAKKFLMMRFGNGKAENTKAPK